MRIKVCGLKYADNIEAVAALNPDYMGFICYNKSPRFIDGLDEETLFEQPADIIKTGVFVNEDADMISKLIYKYKFDAIQLHGNELPEFCALFKHEVEVIKAFGVDEDFDFGQLAAYKDVVDYFLYDTKTPAHGGSGKTFNWEILDKYTLGVPFFLSGGLSPENISEVIKIKHPAFYGVDLNSKFEDKPGLKNIIKLKQAFEQVKNEI